MIYQEVITSPLHRKINLHLTLEPLLTVEVVLLSEKIKLSTGHVLMSIALQIVVADNVAANCSKTSQQRSPITTHGGGADKFDDSYHYYVVERHWLTMINADISNQFLVFDEC